MSSVPVPGSAPLARIPHRPPFLLLDEVLELTDTDIRARKRIDPRDELLSRVYAGHYPGNPITPGVLLCEMVFQAGAVLMARRLGEEAGAGKTPVLTKIENARFKQPVLPGDTVEILAEFRERLGSACYMRGRVVVAGKPAVRVDFTVALV